VAAALIRCLAALDEAQPAQTSLALAAAELAATAFLEWGGAEATRQALAGRLVGLLTDPALPDASPPLRAAAGRALGRLGDPRAGIGVIVEPIRALRRSSWRFARPASPLALRSVPAWRFPARRFRASCAIRWPIRG
jgi:HEAT repeat protein